MTERKYLPTYADLIDRLSIVLLKSIYVPENRKAYREEIELIQHDLADLEVPYIFDEIIYAVLVLMLANRVIWENEDRARMGYADQDKLLKFTHSINGVRTKAKNVLASLLGERVDPKVNCLAAELPPEFGNWNVFD